MEIPTDKILKSVAYESDIRT